MHTNASESKPHKYNLLKLFFLGYLLFAACMGTARGHEPQVVLTPEERAWLEAHPDIRFTFSEDYKPMLIKGPDGELSGMMKDFLDILNQRLGTHFGIIVTTIESARKMATDKKAAGQLALTAGNGPNRRLIETHDIFVTYPVVYVRHKAVPEINKAEDLRGRTVSILRGTYYAEKFLEPYRNDITIAETGSTGEAMKLLYEGKTDAMIGTSLHRYHIAVHQLIGLEPAFIAFDQPTHIVMGVRDDWPELVGILNKGLKSVSAEERNAIYSKWILLPQQKSETVPLTPEENAWLSQNHTVRVRIPDLPPFIILRKGEKPTGISIDYLDIIARKTGIRFDYVLAKEPFANSLKTMRNGQGPDLNVLMMATPEWEKSFSFSKPYYTSPRVIFTRTDGEFVHGIRDLKGKTVSVISGTFVHRMMEKHYPGIRRLLVPSDKKALEAVATGEADAFIGTLTLSNYLIAREGYTNLKVAAPSPFEDHALSFASRKDWPELSSIISKTLDTISEEDHAAIRRKYLSVRYEHGIRWADVMKWSLIAAGTASALILLFFLWNRTLAQQVRSRTAELEHANHLLNEEIRERKRAEEQLRQSRDYIRHITDSMGDVIFSVKIPGREIEWLNNAFQRVFGYDPKECFGKTTEFLHQDRNSFLSMGHKIKNAIAENRDIFHAEAYLKRKNGEIFPAEMAITFYRKKGRAVSLTAVVRDISERKQMEEKLRAGEENYQFLADATFEAIFISEKGICINQNKAAEALFGYTLEEAIGRKGTEWIHPDYRELVAEKMAQETSVPYECLAVRKDGSAFWAEIQAKTQVGTDLHIRITALRDISDRKQTETLLLESKALLDATGRMARVGGWELDAETSEVRWTEETYRIHEVPRDYQPPLEEAIRFFHPDDRDRLSQAIRRALEDGESYDMELRFITAKGNHLWTRTICQPHVVNGKIVRLLGAFQDITERKQAEEQRKALETRMIQSQKMEAIGALAGGIAHDFNNILSVIFGCTELAMCETEEDTPLGGYLQEIFAAGFRARDLVRQILTFARQTEKEVQTVRVSIIAKEVMKFMRASLPATIDIREDIRSQSAVMADPTQIHQILMNLCTNAGHAMADQGGRLEIRLTDIMPDEVCQEHQTLRPVPHIRLSVSDTGTGIPPDMTDSVFEPYFTTKAVGEGTGLGLSVVHGIVKDCGGEITVESELGKGTVFNICLPAVTERPSSETCGSESVPSGTERILLVDDEPSAVRMNQILLRKLGYSVNAFTASPEALEHFRSEPDAYDLVITDMTMPEMTGEQLALELKKIRQDIPIILCTGYHQNIAGEPNPAMNIRAVIFKPVPRNDMANTVREVLDQACSEAVES